MIILRYFINLFITVTYTLRLIWLNILSRTCRLLSIRFNLLIMIVYLNLFWLIVIFEWNALIWLKRRLEYIIRVHLWFLIWMILVWLSISWTRYKLGLIWVSSFLLILIILQCSMRRHICVYSTCILTSLRYVCRWIIIEIFLVL